MARSLLSSQSLMLQLACPLLHDQACMRQGLGQAGGALMISSTVCAVGALRLISMARMPNRMIWMVAPAAYQNGPDTPYLYATLELCSSVAAHVLRAAAQAHACLLMC